MILGKAMPFDETTDLVILQTVAAAVAESHAKAGKWIACRAGCSECCSVLFPITMQDAARLRRGWFAAPPALRDDIRARARQLWQRIEADFPGDTATGLFRSNDEWQEWFLTRHKGHPCPVVDPATGACRLYEHRPVACRLYGHLIQIGEEPQTLCHYCFRGATPEEIDRSRVHVPLEAVEQNALDPGETLITFVLATAEWPPSSTPDASAP